MTPTIALPRRRPAARALASILLLANPFALAADPQPDLLQRATPCCATLAELPYQPLAEDRILLVDVNAESPLFEFDTGRSFVVPLRLPAIEPPYTVEVRSYALGDLVQRSRVFYPSALLLDGDYQVLSRLDAGDLAIERTSYGDATRENHWGLPFRIAWRIVIDAPAARFVVIHTTAEDLATRSPASGRDVIPVIVPGLVTAIPGKKREVEVAHAPDGRLAIRVIR